VIELEDLHEVILCAHSYGGMPVTGAADRVAGRIALLVYIDALVPRDGQSAFDLFPEPFRLLAKASADADGGGWRVPIPASLLPPTGWVPEEERARYVARLRDHPLGSFTEPLRITGAVDTVPRAFVRCTGEELGTDLGGDPIASIAERARDAGWPYRELRAPHDPQLTDPIGTATVLCELATAALP
jgi:pimeloyl-ACP methyl ester carboxylesterase